MKRGNRIGVSRGRIIYEAINEDGSINNGIIEMEAVNTLNSMSTFLLEKFKEEGIPTYFVAPGSNERSIFIRKTTMIPLVFIGRNYTAGSFCKRYGIEEGKKIDPMLISLIYKRRELGNPDISFDDVIALKIVNNDDLCNIYYYMDRIGMIATKYYEQSGLTLIDFEVEFGIDFETGEPILVGDINTDKCHLKQANPIEKV